MLRTLQKAFKSAPEPPEGPKWRPKWSPDPCQNRPSGQIASPRPSPKRPRGADGSILDPLGNHFGSFSNHFHLQIFKEKDNDRHVTKQNDIVPPYNAYTISLKTPGETLQYRIVHKHFKFCKHAANKSEEKTSGLKLQKGY